MLGLKGLLTNLNFTVVILEDPVTTAGNSSCFGEGSGDIEETEGTRHAEHQDAAQSTNGTEDPVTKELEQAQADFRRTALVAKDKVAQDGYDLSAAGDIWLDKFISYNVNVYLPDLFHALGCSSLPPGPWPKFFKLPDSYWPWQVADVVSHVGIS